MDPRVVAPAPVFGGQGRDHAPRKRRQWRFLSLRRAERPLLWLWCRDLYRFLFMILFLAFCSSLSFLRRRTSKPMDSMRAPFYLELLTFFPARTLRVFLCQALVLSAERDSMVSGLHHSTSDAALMAKVAACHMGDTAVIENTHQKVKNLLSLPPGLQSFTLWSPPMSLVTELAKAKSSTSRAKSKSVVKTPIPTATTWINNFTRWCDTKFPPWVCSAQYLPRQPLQWGWMLGIAPSRADFASYTWWFTTALHNG